MLIKLLAFIDMLIDNSATKWFFFDEVLDEGQLINLQCLCLQVVYNLPSYNCFHFVQVLFIKLAI